MGGTVLTNTGTPLFGGWVPPNGFMIQMNVYDEQPPVCWINDNPNATNPLGGPTGFMVGGAIGNYPVAAPAPILFVTPPGYRPMGPVTVSCLTQTWAEVRGW
jgi:hypothetical protein